MGWQRASFCSLAPLEGRAVPLPFHIGLLQSTAQESRALGAHVLARATSPCPSCCFLSVTGWPAAPALTCPHQANWYHSFPGVAISTYAKYCYHKLQKAALTGAKKV